jgi:hypothetical protein
MWGIDRASKVGPQPMRTCEGWISREEVRLVVHHSVEEGSKGRGFSGSEIGKSYRERSGALEVRLSIDSNCQPTPPGLVLEREIAADPPN